MNSKIRLLSAIPVCLCLVIAAVSAHQVLQGEQDQPVADTKAGGSKFGATRFHSVRLDQEGNLDGYLFDFVASDVAATEVVIVRYGKILSKGLVNENGEFRVSNLSPGLATLFVESANGFTVFGIELLEHDPELPTTLLETGLVTRHQYQSKTFIKSQEHFDRYQPNNKDEEIIAGGNRVQIVDGKLVGTIWSFNKERATDAMIRLTRDDQTVGVGTTDMEGRFQIEDLEAGFHAVTVRGSSGIAAILVELVESTSDIPTSIEYQAPRQELNILLARQPDTPWVRQVYEYEAPITESTVRETGVLQTQSGAPTTTTTLQPGPMMSVNPVTGVNPTGLLTRIGLTVGIIALFDDNDGNPPPPTSPIQ